MAREDTGLRLGSLSNHDWSLVGPSPTNNRDWSLRSVRLNGSASPTPGILQPVQGRFSDYDWSLKGYDRSNSHDWNLSPVFLNGADPLIPGKLDPSEGIRGSDGLQERSLEPSGPLGDSGPRRGRPPRAQCSWGQLTLTIFEQCPGGIACQLDGVGLSPAPQTYSVVFTARSNNVIVAQAAGTLVTGANWIANGVINGLEGLVGQTVAVTARVTGFGGSTPTAQNPCAGLVQETPPKLIRFFCLCHPQCGEFADPPWGYILPGGFSVRVQTGLFPTDTFVTISGPVETIRSRSGALLDGGCVYSGYQYRQIDDGFGTGPWTLFEVAIVYIACQFSMIVDVFSVSEYNTPFENYFGLGFAILQPSSSNIGNPATTWGRTGGSALVLVGGVTIIP